MAPELLQARQLIESNVAEFAATQIRPQDIVALLAIQEKARQEDHARDSTWDMEFHVHCQPPKQRAGRHRRENVAAPAA